MLKLKIYIGVLLICCAGMWSCKKNTQDFNYEEINELTITGQTSFAVTQFDTLKIDPQITQSKADGENFSYQWKIYPTSAVDGVDAQVISTDKALKAVVSVPPLSASYILEYKVTNTTNGVSAFRIYNIQVSSVFSKGWLVSNNANGKAQLGFIRSDYRIFYTPAESVNKTTFQGNAVGAYTSSNFSGSQFNVNFFTDNGNYRFNANDFLSSGKATTGFKPEKDNFAFGLSKFLVEEFLINNGSLYAATLFDEPKDVVYTERLPGDYQLFPKVISSESFSTYFYDNKNKRFMSSVFSTLTLTPSFGSSTASFNMGDTKMLMIAAADGAKTSSADEFFFLMQDGNSERYLYSLVGSKPGLNQKILTSPEISSAKSIAASLILRQLYYATDNKIYLYDILANSSRLLYTFPSGVKIKQLEIDRTDSKTLVVAANNGTSGEVYFFKLNNVGSFTNGSFDKKIDGFGEIANIFYRK